MTAVLWTCGALAAIALAARLKSLIHPTAFPPWLTPILETGWRSRDRILDRSGLAPGMRVLEIGPGAGWITERAAEKLGRSGRLVCLDLQPAMLRKVRSRLGEATPPLVCASGSELPFRAGVFDLLFLVTVLGEIPDRPAAMAEFARVLRAAGVLAVTEELPDPDYVRPPVLLRLANDAGFQPRDRIGNWVSYTQRFARL